ncbi:MAG TPA: histidine kinase, partial [Acidimicrobiia bacterium]
IAAAGGVGGSIALVALFAAYLTRVIVGPLRRAAAMAGNLAGGDLSVRMPETGPGEVGALERSFNTMASSLEGSQGELRRLFDEQASLRRLATLVARGAAPTEVFDAVVREAHRTLDPSHTVLVRYGADGTFVVLAVSPDLTPGLAVGRSVRPEDQTIAARVFQTGRAARADLAGDGGDTDSVLPWAPGVRCAVAAPIGVEGRLWGALVAGWTGPEPVMANVEDRLGEFTELIATAIANADSRAQLAASRARVVAAGDETRRRIERDLHDGVQQGLVSIALGLRGAEAAVRPEDADLKAELTGLEQTVVGAIEELRELSRGIHPAVLARGGLGAALKALAGRSAVPVRLDVGVDGRLPEPVEVGVYYVVSEALTNAAKHARASVVRVGVQAHDDSVWLSIGDDGIGGADPGQGSGLMGLQDRIEALGGTIDIESPEGGGTSYFVKIPTGAPSSPTN